MVIRYNTQTAFSTHSNDEPNSPKQKSGYNQGHHKKKFSATVNVKRLTRSNRLFLQSLGFQLY